MKLIADIPQTKAQENCIKRAYQLSKVQWYAKAPMPANVWYRTATEPFHYEKAFHIPYATMTGMAYSSCRAVEKFVPYNVSLETFMTALMNPNSVLYTKNLHGVGAGSISSYYGTVCSTFVSHCTGRPYRTICKAWPDLTEEIDVTETLDNMQLCDIIDNPKKHIAIITGLWRDEEGHVQKVEVSESILPVAATRVFNAEQFRGFYIAHDYRIFRYDLPEDLSYTPSPYIPLEGDAEQEVPTYDIMTNWGHNANCLKNLEPVELSVIRGAWDEFAVTAPDGSVKTYPAGEKVKVETPVVGDYTAVAKKGEAVSTAVCWHVVDLQADCPRTCKVGEPLEITFQNAEDDAVFHCMVNAFPTNSILRQKYLTEEEAKAGCITVEGLPVGRCWVIVIAKNKNGAYCSNHVYLDVTE